MTKRLTIALVALALFVLVAVMPVSALYYNVSPYINQGATVYIGEQGLNVTGALNQAQAVASCVAGPTGCDWSAPVNTSIGWWASAAVIATTSPSKTIDLAARYKSFSVASADFVGYTGNWYLLNGTAVSNASYAVFTVADPTLDIAVWDFNQNVDVTGKSVPQGEYLGFKISTNMYGALDSRYRSPLYYTTANTLSATPINTGDGYIDIKVKDESGTTFTKLLNSYKNTSSIVAQNVSVQPYIWGQTAWTTTLEPSAGLSNWSTDVLNTYGQSAYPTGTYTVYAESYLNNMKDNYKNAGADYSGKTVSQTYTITLVSSTVKIAANKDSVVRSKPFSVTITGRPSITYHVWVKGTSTLTGGYDSQPPMINANQLGVKPDTFGAAPYVVNELTALINDGGNYTFQNGGTIWADVARGTYTPATVPPVDYRGKLGNGTYVYANVTLSTSGTRTVEFITTNWTKAQTYTIRVELLDGAQYKSDEVDVKVEKGAVTITAAGDQSYYLGEEVKFSGTNTESANTYLFIIGPNLNENGAELLSPRTSVSYTDASTFVQCDVLADNTWSYKWGTSTVPLDAGTYTIYAVSQPVDRDATRISKVVYGTVSIIIKKPFISATASQSTVAQGDNIFVTGTAEGQPSKGVAIWVLGKNYASYDTESVSADASYSLEIKKEDTKTLAAGQYFVVAQHPMQNNAFDIDLNPAASGRLTGTTVTYVRNEVLGSTGGTGTDVFLINGAGSLQGTDAAEALVQAINDPNVDDTYTKLAFLIEVPVISVAPIGDRHVGDKFTITATTNLAVDDEVLFEVYSSSFKPTQKSQSGEFSGATGTIKVIKGESGLNKLTFDVDASTFKPDEYIVKAEAVLQEATGTALFNVLEGVAPTAVPTAVKTAVAPVVTTAAPTAAATPTKTPTQPGFGALVALIGLGAVAFLVVRKH